MYTESVTSPLSPQFFLPFFPAMYKQYIAALSGKYVYNTFLKRKSFPAKWKCVDLFERFFSLDSDNERNFSSVKWFIIKCSFHIFVFVVVHTVSWSRLCSTERRYSRNIISSNVETNIPDLEKVYSNCIPCRIYIYIPYSCWFFLLRLLQWKVSLFVKIFEKIIRFVYRKLSLFNFNDHSFIFEWR